MERKNLSLDVACGKVRKRRDGMGGGETQVWMEDRR